MAIDHARHQRPVFFRPRLHHERNPQRPFAAHAERGDKARHQQVPRFRGEIDQTGEQRVEQHAQRHRADAPDAIAQPAKDDAARGRAEEERGGHVAHPLSDKRVRDRDALGSLHELQGGARDERKQAHFEAIEHPAEGGGDQNGVETLVGRLRGGWLHKGIGYLGRWRWSWVAAGK
jgi:hypothetical protein